MAEPIPSPSGGRPVLLDINRLRVSFDTGGARLVAVHDVDLSVAPGETLGLVGESGSGKTMTLRSVIRLLPRAAVVESGEVIFEGVDMFRLPREQLREIRARAIGTVFQDPYSSLNPVTRVGDQLAEATPPEPRPVTQRGRAASRRGAASRRHTSSREARSLLPARVEWRDASAGDVRHRHGSASSSFACGRTHHRS